MAESKGIFGDTYVTEDKAIAIPIKRYNELIRKEVFFDELNKNGEPLVVMLTKKQEEN